MFRFLNLRLMGRDEEGRVRLMWATRLGSKFLSIDLYTWSSWRWNAWAMWSMGVLGNVRLGRVEMQIRFM